MDQLHGVDFDKGCFVGQEVVSRIEHRAIARARIVPVGFEGPPPEAGIPVMAGDRNVGMMGSGMTGRGLATLRLDRVEDALANGAFLVAGGIKLEPLKASWGPLCHAGKDKGRRMSIAISHPDGLTRCPWPKLDPLYIAYHDDELGCSGI